MIKNKLKIGLVMAMVAMVAMSGMASAANINYDADSPVDLSSPDIDLTIKSGSKADSVIINAGSVQITIPAGDTFIITSASRGLTVDGSTSGITVSQTCSQALLDTVTITSTGSATGSYVITPTASQCSYSAGGTTSSSTSSSSSSSAADETAPTNTSISIAGDAETAETTSVTLTLGATGASQMMIANDADFTDASWETYAASKEWTLTSGDAEKTVYAKFKDSSNNESAAVSDTITLAGTGETEEEAEEAAEEEAAEEEATTPTDAITPFSDIQDGDIIQAKTSSNPFAVYIVKVVGDTKYIRHIVSLDIFNYYTHLKWENLKQVDSLTNYSLSGWVRVNTGPNNTPGPTDKVYEINGDQTKHWINMTAEQFLTHGGSDAAIYSVNQGELDMYTTGADVMSL